METKNFVELSTQELQEINGGVDKIRVFIDTVVDWITNLFPFL